MFDMSERGVAGAARRPAESFCIAQFYRRGGFAIATDYSHSAGVRECLRKT